MKKHMKMNSFKSLYYRIWVDAIKEAMENDKDGTRDWKIGYLIIFSMAQGINILSIIFYAKVYVDNSIDIFIKINLFNDRVIDSFIPSFTFFYFPFFVLNYFLILHKKRYLKLIKKYDKGFRLKRGVVLPLYLMSSVLIFILPIIIGMIVGS